MIIFGGSLFFLFKPLPNLRFSSMYDNVSWSLWQENLYVYELKLHYQVLLFDTLFAVANRQQHYTINQAQIDNALSQLTESNSNKSELEANVLSSILYYGIFSSFDLPMQHFLQTVNLNNPVIEKVYIQYCQYYGNYYIDSMNYFNITENNRTAFNTLLKRQPLIRKNWLLAEDIYPEPPYYWKKP